MKGPSLRFRLVAGGAAALAVALIAAAFGLAFLFERHATRVVSDELEVVLRQLAGAVEIGPDGHLLLSVQPADPRFAAPLSGLYWQVGDSRGDVLRSRSLWDTVLALPDDRPLPSAVHQHRIAGPAGQRLLVTERMIRLPDRDQDRLVRLAVAADRIRIEGPRAAFVADLLPALFLLGLLLAAATWVQIGLGLAPLAGIRRGIAAVRAGASRRLPTDVPTEVRPLVEEVNALLAAQEAAVERARGRAADLAHGLKTPLAALAADSRRLRERGQADIAANLEQLGEAMRRHIERELVRARLQGSARRVAGATPLLPVVDGVVATLARTPAGERVRFDIAVSADQTMPFNRTDLAEILGNLLDNAARHARTRVRVQAQGKGAVTALTVEDDGPGVPEAARDAVIHRGIRLDQTPGTGLGLAIVQEVAEDYGWHLILATSPLGGLAATISRGSDEREQGAEG